MTTVTYYRNKRNKNKYIEVHNDGHYHNAVRQFMLWAYRKWNTNQSFTKNFTGDGHLYSWRRWKLDELLEDYEPVTREELINMII